MPPRVEYRLTDLGASLIPVFAGLHEWADRHGDLVARNQARSDEARAAAQSAAT